MYSDTARMPSSPYLRHRQLGLKKTSDISERVSVHSVGEDVGNGVGDKEIVGSKEIVGDIVGIGEGTGEGTGEGAGEGAKEGGGRLFA